jgi:hypothetical protein
LNGVKNFDAGGYTGPGGKYQPAGIVHADEFVLRKEATASLVRAVGMAGLDYMNLTGKLPGYSGGGRVAAPSYRPAPINVSRGSSIDYGRLASAMASQMPPMLSVYSGEDAKSASRTAIRDWEWEQVR